jgi:hypothetical protein
MEAFRNALKIAYNKNSSISYTLKKDYRSANIFGGYGQGQPAAVSASANVMWQKGLAGTQGKTDDNTFGYYQVNDQWLDQSSWKDVNLTKDGILGNDGLKRYKKTTYGYDGSEREVNIPVSVWKEEIAKEDIYEAKDDDNYRKETETGITNKKLATLSSKVKTQVYTRFDKSEDEKPWDDTPADPKYNHHESVNSLSQGAYYDSSEKNIKYSVDEVGNEITSEKKWVTEHDLAE